MKESFGFIERADVVKEIFFHFSEAKSMKEELKLGDDVEFIIQTRNVSAFILLKYRLLYLRLEFILKKIVYNLKGHFELNIT